MKLKKIKNYILTFIVCLLGAFAFNVIETKAVTIVGNVTANEGDVYFQDYGTSDQKSLQIMASPDFNPNSSNSQLKKVNVVFTSLGGNLTYTAVYNNCNIINYTAGSFIDFNCSGRYVYTSDNSERPNDPNSKFYFNISQNVNGVWEIGARYTNNGSSTDYTFVKPPNNDYNDGYDAGYDNGYDVGYDAGEQAQNTLVGMVGAIFTGPVTMFQEIFNFNVLGINFAEMLLGLVTLLVVIWLIKKFI